MYLSVLLTSLPLDFADALRQAAALGFSHVDVVALAERPAEHLEALADSGLLVSCAAVGRGLPDGCTLDAQSISGRREALELMKRQVTDAARLGATHAYVVSGMDASPAGLARFGESCALLAAHAAARMVQLCVEHVPGRALPSVAAALDWLQQPGHEELALLLDVGHCLISDEDPARATAQAGSRLGYLHLDDNDSVSDLHWPLLSGRLTADMLEALFAVLRAEEYTGALALELNPANPDPLQALREGKAVVEGLMRTI